MSDSKLHPFQRFLPITAEAERLARAAASRSIRQEDSTRFWLVAPPEVAA